MHIYERLVCLSCTPKSPDTYMFAQLKENLLVSEENYLIRKKVIYKFGCQE